MGSVVGLFWVDPPQPVNHQTLHVGSNKAALRVPKFACRWHQDLLRSMLRPDRTVKLPTWLPRADFVPKAMAHWALGQGLAPSNQWATRCGYAGTNTLLAAGKRYPHGYPPGRDTESAPEAPKQATEPLGVRAAPAAAW